MARKRINFIGGKVDDDPLLISATSFNSGALGAISSIVTPDYLPIVLDPDGVYGAPEVVWVTAHTAATTVATIARGKEGTAARQHPNDTYWAHAALASDFDYNEAAASIYFSRTFI